MTILNYLFVLFVGMVVGAVLHNQLLKLLWLRNRVAIGEKLADMATEAHVEAHPEEYAWMSEADKAELREMVERAIEKLEADSGKAGGT